MLIASAPHNANFKSYSWVQGMFAQDLCTLGINSRYKQIKEI